MANGTRWLLTLIAALALGFFLFPSRADPPPDALIQRVQSLRQSDLPEMLDLGIIRVLVSPSRTGFFLNAGQPRGFSYDLASEFRDYLDAHTPKRDRKLTLIFVPVPFDELIPALLSGKGDVIASNFTVTPDRAKQVAFSDPYISNVDEVVVSGPESHSLNSLAGLAGQPLLLVDGSSYVTHAQALSDQLKKSGKKPIKIHVPERPLEAEDILELVAAGSVPYTACDKHIADLWAKVLPELKVHDDLVLSGGNNIAFAVRPKSKELLAKLNDFVADHKKGTLLGNILYKRYYTDTKWCKDPLKPADRARIERMTRYFKTYAPKYDFDWLLMAAQGYQESQLDQNKRSPVGAIGVMQILPRTGQEMNVGPIDVEENNIHAGIKYMAWLRENYFADSDLRPGPKADFTLAAYNAGPGRIRQLREKAKSQGLDPNIWFDNVEQIAMEEIGPETVRYVRNINKYYVAYSMMLTVQEERTK